MNVPLKKKPLYSIFTAVPGRYDLINRIFTLGMDESWRKRTARICLEGNPEKVLDTACGTGDLALWIARLAKPRPSIFALDYSQPMLDRAIEKAQALVSQSKVTFIHGDVSSLPFPDNSFEVVGISFAFRNLTYKNPMTAKYLSEIVRIIKPGGRFIIVESSQPHNKIIRKISHAYIRLFVRAIGIFISKNRPAYNYLAESARKFYTAEELSDLLIQAGFERVTFKRLFFGACAIHIAKKETP